MKTSYHTCLCCHLLQLFFFRRPVKSVGWQRISRYSVYYLLSELIRLWLCVTNSVLSKSFVVVYFKVDTYILHVTEMSEGNHEHSSQHNRCFAWHSEPVLSVFNSYYVPLSTCSLVMLVLLACMDSWVRVRIFSARHFSDAVTVGSEVSRHYFWSDRIQPCLPTAVLERSLSLCIWTAAAAGHCFLSPSCLECAVVPSSASHYVKSFSFSSTFALCWCHSLCLLRMHSFDIW